MSDNKDTILDLSVNMVKSVVKTLQSANLFQAATSDGLYDYYSTFKGFRQLNNYTTQDLEKLISSMLRRQGVDPHFSSSEELFDIIKNFNINALEKVGVLLDKVEGKNNSTTEDSEILEKPKAPIATSWNNRIHGIDKDESSPAAEAESLEGSLNIPRPQVKYKWHIDNSPGSFIPIITYKPHSLKPLSLLPELAEDGVEEYSHPYEIEIEAFHPPEEALEKVTPQVPKKESETPFQFVDNLETFKEVCKELESAKELAIDLEHHSFRSFQGFTCLMQISSREKDYIIDTIELRNYIHLLNEVFTNPKILKVLHGADWDILWLQRDFGVYLVNMFDTGQAARLLSYPHLSLAYLFKRFFGKVLDKKYQLADWRRRPLPAEMMAYARSDTHSLLYIYDCLKNELLDMGNANKNLLKAVYNRSKEICLKRYRKPSLNDDSHLHLFQRYQKRFNHRQMEALKKLYAWRDQIARQKDESLGYVLPNHMLLNIAETLPREQQGILACCNPIPVLVKQYQQELHQIIYKARGLSLHQNEENKTSHPTILRFELGNTHFSIPHDMWPPGGFRDDYNEFVFEDNEEKAPLKEDSVCTLFNKRHQYDKLAIEGYLTPFEMYERQVKYEMRLEKFLERQRASQEDNKPKPLCVVPSESSPDVQKEEDKKIEAGPEFMPLPSKLAKNKRQKRLEKTLAGEFKPFDYEKTLKRNPWSFMKEEKIKRNPSEKKAQKRKKNKKQGSDFNPNLNEYEFKKGKRRKIGKKGEKSSIV